MNKKEIHAYLDEALEREYSRWEREGYQKGVSDGYRRGKAAVILPHPCDGELLARLHEEMRGGRA